MYNVLSNIQYFFLYLRLFEMLNEKITDIIHRIFIKTQVLLPISNLTLDY